MPGNLRRITTAGALLGTYGLGMLANAAPAHEPTRTTQASNILSPSLESNLGSTQQQFVEAIGSLGSARLVVLEHADTFYCPPMGPGALISGEADTYSSFAPFYCWSEDVVVFGAGSYNALNNKYVSESDKAKQVFGRFILAHENGHALQNRDGLDATIIGLEGAAAFELQADCKAGELLKKIGSNDIPQIEEILQSLPSDLNHGTGAERAKSFMRGARGLGCN